MRHAPTMQRVLRYGLLAVACLLLAAACSDSPHKFRLTDVTGSQADLALFKAPTAEGDVLTAEDLRGKVVALYFGYTHCPDICPTTLAKLQAVAQRLGEAANQLQIVFVTVDPKRDTPAVLERFIDSFSPQFIALRPNSEVLPQLTSRYHLTYSYAKRDSSGAYAVNHTNTLLIFDQTGQLRLMGTYEDSVKDIAGDITYLINHSG